MSARILFAIAAIVAASSAPAQERRGVGGGGVFSSAPPGEMQERMTSLEGPAEPVAGPPVLSPYLAWSVNYSDGLQSGPGKPTNTYLQAYTAGIDIQRGRWGFAYSHNWNDYSNRVFSDNQSDRLMLGGQFQIRNWAAAVSQDYSSSSEVNTETATQVAQETVGTSFELARVFGTRLQVRTSGSQLLNFVEDGGDTFNWNLNSSFQYRVSPATTFGLLLGGGYTRLYQASDTASFRPGLSVGWTPSAKLSASADISAEELYFISGGRRKVSTAVYGASLRYAPFETTLLGFQGSRQLAPSLYTGNYLESDSWSVSIRQRFLGRLNFGATFSESWSRYILTQTTVSPTFATEEVFDDDGRLIGYRFSASLNASTVFLRRTDVQRSVNLSLGTTWLQHGTATAIYRQSRNSTKAIGYAYSSKQIGFEAGWHF